MRRYTVATIMGWEPCYNLAEVKELFGRRRSATLVDILSSAKLDDYDAIWCAFRAMDARQQRLFGCDCAESVVHLTTDPRVAACIAVARLYADGLATDEELRAASAAAYAAAYAPSAAPSAAHAAHASAAHAAASAAAHAADDAAYAAHAADAAYAAAYAPSTTSYAAYAAHGVTYAAERETQRHALLALALAGEIQ
jgi:hypothetical protein